MFRICPRHELTHSKGFFQRNCAHGRTSSEKHGVCLPIRRWWHLCAQEMISWACVVLSALHLPKPTMERAVWMFSFLSQLEQPNSNLDTTTQYFRYYERTKQISEKCENSVIPDSSQRYPLLGVQKSRDTKFTCFEF